MAEPRKPDQPVQVYRFSSRKGAVPVLPANDCLTALRALGEETRARIVALLVAEPMDVNEIATQLAISPYNASKHLRVLREAGLLQVERSGRKRRYTLRGAVRRKAEAGNVLDLGCCSFQFEPNRTR